MGQKKGITIPTWIIYALVIGVVIVLVYYAVPGGKETLIGFGTTAFVSIRGWAGTIGESEIWQGYWWAFTGVGAILVFMLGRWTMKKENNLYGWFANKAWNRARETDPTIGMDGRGYGGSGPQGPGGLSAEQMAAMKRQEEQLP